MNSMIYKGSMMHRRYSPTCHRFGYDLSMMYFDLDELSDLISSSWFWRHNKRGLAEFRRSDYHGDATMDLGASVRQTVKETLGLDLNGPIRLLTHSRYLGVLFNPVSFYYCFSDDGSSLEVILAEITNTPWMERHAYALDCRDALNANGQYAFSFAKDFHISPFMDMDQTYEWRFSHPENDLRVFMRTIEDGLPKFDASMGLASKAMTGRALDRYIMTYPFMTMKVIAGIYWQSLRLKLKRTPFYPHPDKRAQEGEHRYVQTQ